jgi:hypothetical protein
MNEENTQALQALKDVAMESVKEQRRARLSICSALMT